MLSRFIEAFGWYGTAAVLTAYALNSFSVLGPTSGWYLFLNISGAIGVAAASLRHKAYQPAVINVIWAATGAAAAASLLWRS